MSALVPWIGGAAATAALGGVGAELGARTWIARRGRYYVWPPHWRAEVRLDAEGLPWLPPVARWSINSAGERGAEPPRDPTDTARVLVAGGSTTECWFIDQPSTWPEVLAGLLNEPGVPARFGANRVHVGNIGRSVMDAEYQTAIFEKILPNYERLDLVVLFMGNSEAVRWMQLREAPEYPTELLPTSKLFRVHPEGPFGWRPSALASRRVLKSLRYRWKRSPDVIERAGKRLPELRRRRNDAARWIEEMSDLTPLLEHYAVTLRRLLRTLRGRAKRVLYIAQPWLDRALDSEEHRRTWNFGFGRPYHEDLDTYYRYDVARAMLHAVRRRGLDVAAAEGVEALDMVGMVPSDFEHYYDSLHHTPLGNAVVAERVAAALIGRQAAAS